MILRISIVEMWSSGIRRSGRIRACRYYSQHSNDTPRLSRNVVDELESRGFVAALTNPNIRETVNYPTCIYAGIDPSASSLHVGNLLPLLGLLHFQVAGHQALAVIGGATGSIGDPSGRSSERPALTAEELETNVQGITEQVHRFFDRGVAYISRKNRSAKGKEKEETVNGVGVKVLNNLDWFKGISFLDFLTDIGKLAKVNVMLSRDSVKNRLSTESGISFTEFSYQLLQAHDFSHLHQTHGCRIQLGGSDQWGNIVAGIDLIKRSRNRVLMSNEIPSSVEEKNKPGKEVVEEAYGLTIPLLTTASGEKFGKSAGNAIWLDEGRTSISDFYQFFLRATDADVEQYLRLLTLLPMKTINEVMVKHSLEPEKRQAQKLLADEITELVHGLEGVIKAQTAASVLFSSTKIKASDIISAFTGDPRLVILNPTAALGVSLTKLAVGFGLIKSRAEGGRIIHSGGFYINDQRISDPSRILMKEDLIDGEIAILRTGKTSHLIIQITDDL